VRRLVALIAFLLTLLARRAIDGPVPLFLVRATCPGTGKTLAVDAVSQIALGAPAARMLQGARYSAGGSRLEGVFRLSPTIPPHVATSARSYDFTS
jgi:hypothetical protein